MEILYRGSVKDVLGPTTVQSVPVVLFEYTDAYSVFDWGKMPDALSRKGEALAVLAAHWFEQLERAEAWREFSKSPEALALRKGSRFGSVFNELGEELQKNGLRTHYLGVGDGQPQSLAELKSPVHHLVVKHVSVVKPALATVLGRTLADYYPTRNAPAPRLVPLEVVFRFSCPEGSSLLGRAARDPGYMSSLGFPDIKPEEAAKTGQKWDFPVLELFTKLETTDRPVSMSEALAISGLSAAQLQDLLLRTAWVAGLLKWLCRRSGLELADGKLEWGISESGQCFLVDAIGPDELRLLKGGVQLSKEFLRNYYRETPWYQALLDAKQQAKVQGTSDWKRLVATPPPQLPAPTRELATQLYLALANELTGRVWFPDAWSLNRVVEEIGRL